MTTTRTKTTNTLTAVDVLAAEVDQHKARGPQLAAGYAAAVQAANEAGERLETARDAAELARHDHSGELTKRAERIARAEQVADLAKADTNRLGSAVRAAERRLEAHNASIEVAEAVAPLLRTALPGSLTISQTLPMVPQASPKAGHGPVIWLAQTEPTITDPDYNQHDKLAFSGPRATGSLAGKLALIVFQPDYLAGVDLIPDAAIVKALGTRLRVLRDGGMAGKLKRSVTTEENWIRTVIELDIRAVFPQVPVIVDFSEVTEQPFQSLLRQRLIDITDRTGVAITLVSHRTETEGDHRTVTAEVRAAVQSSLRPAEVAEAVARLASWAEGRMVRGVGRVASTKLGQVDATSAPAVARTLRLVIESKTSAPE